MGVLLEKISNFYSKLTNGLEVNFQNSFTFALNFKYSFIFIMFLLFRILS